MGPALTFSGYMNHVDYELRLVEIAVQTVLLVHTHTRTCTSFVAAIHGRKATADQASTWRVLDADTGAELRNDSNSFCRHKA